ncbi:hypothetical protein AJ85_17960 [Alkalihalobacillus alcalophilus ATCC 27647 = CGMCC 1.3604]|uniref:DEAD/DEAH box helicase n=1 Tax=Alkalihalobacillus alcalophilus ATCC 27647 = CGMCC 1.3604 TaxID=1218173 RepID=A0A094WFY6_ALKAL|nr:DEAD/DEAH box helicase [Alkalihalobacillus alcalophilus]KGA96684.1 hypothetical protein BALCAV_0214730 [Alkalihalobacillus alcalophilus ATCC 27647 = CGMCC 1.3604]MED1562385.1 DEAD/DEAH box helicase [Alkalihalobacillus alcalophilus]THG89393.1 hypothetical protein AJ85_17960 [Alkalihalobacillus alcalophilus ATCC 27647 = CGMCC 1.3604]
MMNSTTERDIQKCVELLTKKYQVPTRLIIRLIGTERAKQIEQMVFKMSGIKLTELKLIEMVVREKGEMLFAGSDINVRDLRTYLLKSLGEKELIQLYQRNPDSKKAITASKYMITPLVKKKWLIGGKWPKDFVRTLGFPLAYAGMASERSFEKEPILEIEPRKMVPPLVDFQANIKEDMLRVLRLEGEHTRCVVTMPTGTGKTRVAVESYIEWMREGFADGKYLIWIAQSEELCEQAIDCIADMWQEKEYPEPLRIYRYFAGNKVRDEQLRGGAVIASIQQLYYRAKADDPVLQEMLRHCGAMIIDEAHHAVAPMYSLLLEKAEELVGPKLFPICGLTATPGRNDEQTVNLVNKFEAYLIQPKTGRSNRENPLTYFRERGYLAKPKHVIYQSGRAYEVDEQKVQADAELISAELLSTLANDVQRNEQILTQLFKIPNGSSTLVYTCTVDHAEQLSQTMNAMGYRSAAISGETLKATRRIYIDAFKKGQIQFLFNYGVLTTGFDAPKTDYIVICRPTTSIILYEQIVGRGLRGPKFGGTETCTIIDFADNLLRLGKPLAYARFQGFWEQEVMQ